MRTHHALTAEERATFPIGQAVRYKPGFGTYGFEDCLEADGRLPGVVLGHTDTRVRIEMTLAQRGGGRVVRTVNAASLIHVDAITFDELAIGDTFEWRDTEEIQHGPPGPEPMRKASATRYEWSKGYGTAEPQYPVQRIQRSASSSS